jgi:hypothetical protein
MLDNATVLAVNCSNYDTYDLTFQWSINGLNASSAFQNGYSSSQLMIKPYALTAI